MCEYCDLSDYTGNIMKPHTNIDGKGEYTEVYLLLDVENECNSLQVDGTYIDHRIKINFCPMCGREL